MLQNDRIGLKRCGWAAGEGKDPMAQVLMIPLQVAGGGLQPLSGRPVGASGVADG